MVGDTSFPCRATTGGGLSVAGHEVRSITLGERNQLLALTTGADRRGQVATLVREAATGPLDASTDRDVVDAIEAVALHLAGASLPGSLARTTLLVGRSMGDAAAGITALEADRLAEAIEDALALPHRTSAGWTTISYPSSEPGSSSTAGPEAGRSVASVRDELAALLIERDEESLSGDLADALLRRTDVASTADIPSSLVSATAPTRRRRWPDPWRSGSQRPDRWHCRPSTGPMPRPAVVRRICPVRRPSIAGRRRHHRHPRRDQPGRQPPVPGTRDVAPASVQRAEARTRSTVRMATRLSPRRPPTTTPTYDSVRLHRSAPRRPRVRQPRRASQRDGAPRPPRSSAPPVARRRHRTSSSRTVRHRAAHDRVPPVALALATASRVDDAVGDPNVPAATFDLERAAMALHRAADLRGASR